MFDKKIQPMPLSCAPNTASTSVVRKAASLAVKKLTPEQLRKFREAKKYEKKKQEHPASELLV